MPVIRCFVLVVLLPVMLLGMSHDLYGHGVKDGAATPPGPGAAFVALPVTSPAPCDDVRGKDLTALGGKLDAVLLRTLWLNGETKLDAAGARTLTKIVEAGRNPGQASEPCTRRASRTGRPQPARGHAGGHRSR